MKVKLKPSEITLDNQGATYEPADTSALDDSYGITKGWVVDPVIYRDPFDGKWKCLEGNHRVLLLRKKGWDEPIDFSEKEVPKEVKTPTQLLEWKLLMRVHANSKRRKVPIAEWRAVFSRFRDELGWSQDQIARQCGFDQGDVSRILSGTPTASKERKKKSDGREMVPSDVKVPPKIMGIPISQTARYEPAEPTPSLVTTKDLRNRYLQAAFQAVDDGDGAVITDLRWEAWHIERKLLSVGVKPFDPKDENPEA